MPGGNTDQRAPRRAKPGPGSKERRSAAPRRRPVTARGGKEGLEELEEESDKMISDLGIPHKRDEMSKNLSGGMQRKLSIACAFVGGSRLVNNCTHL